MNKINSFISNTIQNIIGDKVEKYGYKPTGKENGRKYVPSSLISASGSIFNKLIEKAQNSWEHAHPRNAILPGENDAHLPKGSEELPKIQEVIKTEKIEENIFGHFPAEDAEYDELLSKLDAMANELDASMEKRDDNKLIGSNSELISSLDTSDLDNLEKQLNEASKNSTVTYQKAEPSDKPKSDMEVALEMADEAAQEKKEIQEKAPAPLNKETLSSLLINIKTEIDKLGDKKLRFTKDKEFVVKEKKTGLHRTWRHKRSEKTMKQLMFHIDEALKLDMTEVTADGKTLSIKDLITSLQKSKWGIETLKRNPELAKQLEMHKTTTQADIIQQANELRKNFVFEKEGADEVTLERYRQQKLLMEMAPFHKGDAEILAKYGIITPETLLITYSRNMTTEQLFSSINIILESDFPEPVKSNLVEFTIKWIESGLYENVRVKPEVQEKLKDIQEYCDKNGLETESKKLQVAIEMPSLVESSSPDLDINEKEIREWIKNIGASDFSSALMKVQASSIQNISIDDMYHFDDKNGNFIKFVSSQFNHLSGFVVDQIITTDDKENRKQVYQFFVNVADNCLLNNDFNSAMAVLAGLNSSSINRMKIYEDLDKHTSDQFKNLSELLSNVGNYQALRKKFEEANEKPWTPYFGILTSDLTFTKDGNPKIDKNTQNYNIDVLNQYMKTVQLFLSSKESTSKVNENSTKKEQEFQAFIRRYTPLDEDVAYAKSLELVPRRVAATPK